MCACVWMYAHNRCMGVVRVYRVRSCRSVPGWRAVLTRCVSACVHAHHLHCCPYTARGPACPAVDRYLVPDPVLPQIRTCTQCPLGRYSAGGSVTLPSCLACGNAAQRPGNSVWQPSTPSSACTWRCNTGFFGIACQACSDYRAGTGGDALLPSGAAWLNGLNSCVWDCQLGFTRNASVMSLVDSLVRVGGRCAA